MMNGYSHSNVDRLISSWQKEPNIAGNIVELRLKEDHRALTTPFPSGVDPIIQDVLYDNGISTLYMHQSETWEMVQRGQNVVVATGTASGKTLCYNLPILDNSVKEAESRSLYIFPTKALAQDQLNQLKILCRDLIEKGSPDISPAVYDGDTPAAQRSLVRQKARLILSNPDMLHMGILPHHTLWADFFRNLRFVVIDELHIYRGVFGSHIANVIRRLKRVARFYGSHPHFILTSATIANPVQLAGRLIEEPVELVENDGSPHGRKYFLLYNPPIVHKELGIRRSAMSESINLVSDILASNIQTIIFARARRTVELILKNLQEKEANQADRVHGYRSGYLPRERRAIEKSLRQGEARVVVATNALELGIDIGGMGAVILVGYPGTIAATLQQAGRSGRRNEASMAVLVASASPLDQFLVKHPEFLFDRSPEQALVNPDNLLILLQHLRCAAFEVPFREGEGFGSISAELFVELIDYLQQAGVLHASGGRYFWRSVQYPANTISLRSAAAQTVLLQSAEDNRWITIGEVDENSAPWMVHPDAIYLHEGRSYRVDELSFEDHIARLMPVEVDYFTEPTRQVKVEKLSIVSENPAYGCVKYYGEILVTSQVVGYKAIDWYTHEVLQQLPLDMPPTQLRTYGYWMGLDEQCVQQLRESGLWKSDPNNYGPNWTKQRILARQRDHYICQSCGLIEKEQALHVHHKVPFRNFTSYLEANQLDNLVTLCPTCHQRAEAVIKVRSGLAGLSYVLQHISPLFLMCDVSDLGSFAEPESTLCDGKPVVMIYDQIPAGLGLSENLYSQHDTIMHQCYNLVASCSCDDGCPGCVGPSGPNGIGGKLETLALLKLLLSKSGNLRNG